MDRTTRCQPTTSRSSDGPGKSPAGPGLPAVGTGLPRDGCARPARGEHLAAAPIRAVKPSRALASPSPLELVRVVSRLRGWR